MATKQKPAEEVQVCDRCGKEGGYFRQCWVCRGDFCLVCEGIVCGSFGFTEICRACSGRDDVKRVCDRYAAQISPILKKRDAALKRLKA